jgi:pimeloyl-ACP methyl ester carboxylesterase
VFERRGAGRALVLLHGWCLSGRMWAYTAEALAHQFDVIVPDQAGFGRSEDLAGPYEIGRYARDLVSLLEELDVEDAILIGFAFGAAVALSAAVADHRRIAGVVSIGVPSAAHSPYERMPGAMRKDWPEFARRSALAICGQPQSDATLAWLAQIFAATRLDVAIETVGLLARFEPAEVAPSVDVQALFVHGEQDPVVPVEISARCAELAPHGRLEVVPDAGHLVVLDQPQALLELVVAFAAAPGNP